MCLTPTNRLPDWTELRIIPGCLCAARRAIRWNTDRGLGVFRGAVCRGAGTVFVRGAGGEDLRDSAKERLWYAVSPNLLPSDRPLNLHYLLSRDDWLTVTDARGTVISDRVAAVVIAPREQSDAYVFGLFEDTPRSSSTTPADAAESYLDEENRDGDRVFVKSDSYRGALSPESDANQTLDLLARVHIEDLVNDRIPPTAGCARALWEARVLP